MFTEVLELCSLYAAVICGFFFQNISNDIAGFQNRLGMFFFTLALFGFSCLSSLNLFANERILFMRERYVVPSGYLPCAMLIALL